MELTPKGIKERRTQLEKEFETVKKQKEQAKTKIVALDVKLYRLQGKYALLDDLEKEIQEKKPE